MSKQLIFPGGTISSDRLVTDDTFTLPRVFYPGSEVKKQENESPVINIKALKFTATGNSTLGFAQHYGNPEMEYSYDGKNWTVWSTGTNAYADINIADGKSVYVRGNNPNGLGNDSYGSGLTKFKITGSLACEGNIMHLLSYNEDLTTIPCSRCFLDLFINCIGLTSAPELPATELKTMCYSSMFEGCSGLITAPIILPATTLQLMCYYNMFISCNITIAPILPASTVSNDCYKYMFINCRNLNSITMLATNISADSLSDWVKNVSSTGTFTKKKGVTISSGASGIPSGWTIKEVD